MRLYIQYHSAEYMRLSDTLHTQYLQERHEFLTELERQLRDGPRGKTESATSGTTSATRGILQANSEQLVSGAGGTCMSATNGTLSATGRTTLTTPCGEVSPATSEITVEDFVTALERTDHALADLEIKRLVKLGMGLGEHTFHRNTCDTVPVRDVLRNLRRGVVRWRSAYSLRVLGVEICV